MTRPMYTNGGKSHVRSQDECKLFGLKTLSHEIEGLFGFTIYSHKTFGLATMQPHLCTLLYDVYIKAKQNSWFWRYALKRY